MKTRRAREWHSRFRVRIQPVFIVFLSAFPSKFAVASQDWEPKLVCHYQVDSTAKAGTIPFRFSLAHHPKTLSTFQEKMEKGLRLAIIHRAMTQDNIIALFGCQIYYDLWEEEYTIQRFEEFSLPIDESKLKPRLIRSKHKKEALDQCFSTRLTLTVPFSQIRMQTLVDPTNKEQLERTRLWLAKRGIGGNSSIIGKALGSLVRLDNQIEFETICTAIPKT